MPNKQTEQLIEEAVKEFEANFIEKDYLNPEDGLVIKNEPEEILKYFEASIRTIATKSAEAYESSLYKTADEWDKSVPVLSPLNGKVLEGVINPVANRFLKELIARNEALSKPKE